MSNNYYLRYDLNDEFGVETGMQKGTWLDCITDWLRLLWRLLLAAICFVLSVYMHGAAAARQGDRPVKAELSQYNM